jgi:hypothetical protein
LVIFTNNFMWWGDFLFPENKSMSIFALCRKGRKEIWLEQWDLLGLEMEDALFTPRYKCLLCLLHLLYKFPHTLLSFQVLFCFIYSFTYWFYQYLLRTNLSQALAQALEAKLEKEIVRVVQDKVQKSGIL